METDNKTLHVFQLLYFVSHFCNIQVQIQVDSNDRLFAKQCFNFQFICSHHSPRWSWKSFHVQNLPYQYSYPLHLHHCHIIEGQWPYKNIQRNPDTPLSTFSYQKSEKSSNTDQHLQQRVFKGFKKSTVHLVNNVLILAESDTLHTSSLQCQ